MGERVNFKPNGRMTDHAFFNDHRPQVHDPKAAADAWTKTIAFFFQELEG